MKIRHRIILAIIVLLVAGCPEQADLRGIPPVLKIGILPDEDKAALMARYTPLFEYLSTGLGVPYEVKVPQDYSALLDDFAAARVDLAYFGGFSFVRAHEQFNAVPLVMRDIDLRFTSYFLVSADSPAVSLAEFRNKSFGFGSRLSTSGHLMPRYFLGQEGIVPEAFFSRVSYADAHDATAYKVKNREVDIGVANAKIIDKMMLDGRLKRTDLRVLRATPPYTDYVWALQPFFDAATQTRIRDAFLSLSPARAGHREILSSIDAGGFLPASTEDFSGLRNVIAKTGLGR